MRRENRQVVLGGSSNKVRTKELREVIKDLATEYPLHAWEVPQTCAIGKYTDGGGSKQHPRHERDKGRRGGDGDNTYDDTVDAGCRDKRSCARPPACSGAERLAGRLSTSFCLLQMSFRCACDGEKMIKNPC